MNKKSLLLSLVIVLALSVSAFAGVYKCDKFSVNVPEGWSVSQQGTTVTLMASDQSAALTLTMAEKEGASLKDLADAFSKQFNATKPEVDEDGIYYFTFKNPSKVDCNVILGEEGNDYMMLVMIGEHSDMEGIINSID